MKTAGNEEIYLAVADSLRESARRLEDLRESPESNVVECAQFLLRVGALCVSKMVDSEIRQRITGVCRSVGMTGNPFKRVS